MKSLDRKARNLFLAAFAFAILLRVLALLVPIDPYANPDSLSFEATARTIVEEGRIGYVDRDIPDFELRAFRSILYPMLPALGITTGMGTAGVLMIQALLGIGVVVAMAAAARRVYGEKVGIVTAWFGALCWTPILWERQIMSEALYTPLLVFGVWLSVEAMLREEGRYVRGALAGFLLGLATLVRPVGLLAAAVIAVAAFLGAGPRRTIFDVRSWRRRLGLPVVLLAALGLAVVPLVVRNAVLLGRPVVLTSGGHNFWIGNEVGTRADAWAIMAERLPGMGEVEMDRWFYDDLREHLPDLVRSVPRLLIKKLKVTFDPVTRNTAQLPYRWLLPFALAGFVLARARNRPADAVLKLVPLSQIGLAVISLPGQRYRSPADPFLWMLAAAAVVVLWRDGRRGRTVLVLGVLLQGVLRVLQQ